MQQWYLPQPHGPAASPALHRIHRPQQAQQVGQRIAVGVAVGLQELVACSSVNEDTCSHRRARRPPVGDVQAAVVADPGVADQRARRRRRAREPSRRG